jgi:hypothetical protein
MFSLSLRKPTGRPADQQQAAKMIYSLQPIPRLECGWGYAVIGGCGDGGGYGGVEGVDDLTIIEEVPRPFCDKESPQPACNRSPSGRSW